jgi:S1-C subfamily serine protease
VVVVAPVPGKDVSETGVTSVDRPFKIEPRPGSLTLAVETREAGVTITSAVRDLDRDGFAKLIRGSINEGDVITDVDGEAVQDLGTYERQSKNDAFIAGDFVQLLVRRNGVTSQAAFPVAAKNTAASLTRYSYADVSLRLTGFPAVIIHDTIVGRRQCGGPLIDLEGNVVGVNIARFHRCSRFAISQQRILHLIHELSTETPP